MSIIIKLKGLPLEAESVDVRLYFEGLTIPDGGVHIVGGDEGTVFIEFANDEDARQAMSRDGGQIKDSTVKLLLSSRTEMQNITDAARQQKLKYQQEQQLNFQQQQPPTQFIDPRILSQNYVGMMSVAVPQQPPTQFIDPRILSQNYVGMMVALPQQQQQPPLISVGAGGLLDATKNNSSTIQGNRNRSPDTRAGMSSMRGGDDKLFANKRCVLAASNIPYRATSKDIIEFLSEFNIKEDSIRRRYNQKGQPTADAKIAFSSPDAALKALKMMNKKTLCGRPVFLKPV